MKSAMRDLKISRKAISRSKSDACMLSRIVAVPFLVSNTTTTTAKSIDRSISRPTQSDASSSSLNQQSDTPHDDAQNDVRAAETGENDDSSPALLTGSCEFVT